MRAEKRDILRFTGEYMVAFVLGLFLALGADMVTQSLIWGLFSNVLACRIVEFVVCLLVLSGFVCAASGRMAYKRDCADMIGAILALTPVLALQLILALIFQFVSYISGAGFWLGVLFCHGGRGDHPFAETPIEYYLLGMVLCMAVYIAVACLGQYLGYKQRIKSRKKLLNEK